MSGFASVIVPTYCSWTELQNCLDHLARQTVPPEEFEIIVVNNCDDDDMPENMTLPSNARIIRESKPGSYAARNAGIAEAKSDLLFFTDADCAPRPEYLENGLRVFAEQPEIKRFSGAIQLESLGGDWTTPELYDRITSLRQEFYAQEGRAATANVFMRREAFDQVGLFDDGALSGGDMDWAARAREKGLDLFYAANVVVGHPARSTFSKHATKARRLLGAQIRRADEKERKRYFIPPLKRIIPSVGALRRAIRNPEVESGQVFKLWMFHYKLRLILILEQIRLTWFRGMPERR